MADARAPEESADGTDIGLQEAYAVDGPDDNRVLYAKWADTYEQFLDKNRYIYARQVAEIFSERPSAHTGAVLDVGCGTGRVGAELFRLGVSPIDGIDISPEMLGKARGKSGPGGAPAYRHLIEADLTAPLDLATGSYSGIVSSGAFTHGHLGPDVLSELLRVARPGSDGVIGVNSSVFESNGFKDRFDRYSADGVISGLEVELRPVYEGADGSEPNHMACIAVFTVA